MTHTRKLLLGALGLAVAALAYAQTATYFPRIAAGARPDTMVVNGSTITSQVEVNSDTQAIIESHTHSATAGTSAVVYGARSRGTSASPTVVQNGDQLFGLYSVGFDGTDYAIGSSITSSVGGVPGSNDMPGAWAFCTTADGASTPANCFTEDSNGKLNTLTSSVTSAGLALPHGTAPTSPVNGDMWSTTTGLFVRVNGATVGPLVDASSAGVAQTTGSWNTTWTNACTTTPTQTWYYTKTGNVVSIRAMAGFQCTSDIVGFISDADMPASIRPATATVVYGVLTRDNGALNSLAGCLNIAAAGTLQVSQSTTSVCNGANFTASGTKGMLEQGPVNFTYTLE